ncbi:hypothetical protein SAMN04488137_4641 [Fictibacillus solisalsi]|uniref:TIR domain-containing protein n=1 Tax=Fictibacillus solisalsi TaxID=459525 RepID=A0A1H0BS16_9BACL|nr:hypothetical protein [Fictibacillus solisalsi]SDN48454.1 hypothetical protein SAMN04488137_4641 [Fictibacillus solisalsi]
MNTIFLLNKTKDPTLSEWYERKINDELRALGIKDVHCKAVSSEPMALEITHPLVLICSSSILRDTYSYQSAEQVYAPHAKILAIIVHEKVKFFRHRFTNLQFSPLRFIYNPHRMPLRELIFHLLSQLDIDLEVRR